MKKNIIKNIFLYISSFCVSNVFLEEVFISATKEAIKQEFIPSNAVVITKEEILNSNAKNLGEILDMLSIYDISHNGDIGSLKTLRIRNSNANQVLILINGTPINGVAKGSFDLSLISKELIDRIEILPGSTSGLYGANAVGGCVNIITKHSTQVKPQILGSFSYGSLNTFRGNLDFDFTKDAYSTKILLIDEHSDGWRKNSKYDGIFGYANFSTQLLYGKLNLNVLSVTSKKGLPGVTLVSMDEWDGEKEKEASTPYASQLDEFSFIGLGFENNFITSKLSYDIQRLNYDNSKDPSWPEKTDSNLFTLNFLNNIKLPYRFYLLLTYNYTKIRQEYPLNSFDNFIKDVSNLGVGFQKEIISSNFSFIPTLRWDSNSLFGNKFSPQLIFVYNLSLVKLSLTAGTSWRSPTFLDLYWPNQVWLKGNPNLKPEDSYSFDFSFENNLRNMKFTITPFYRYVKNQIRWYPEDPSNIWSAWVPSNVDESVAQGVEVRFSFEVGDVWNNKISVLISDNRIKKKGEEEKGWQKQAYSPLLTGIYSFDLHLPYEFKLINGVKYVSEQYSGDGESGIKLDSYFLWNIKISKNIFKFFNIYCQVNDLLDQKGINRIGYPQYGRSYELGVNLKISF